MRMQKTCRKNEKGQSLTEFGLTAPIFALLLFGSVQLLFMPYQKAMMEKAVWDASRAAVTATTADEDQIKEKMAKVVDLYKQLGYFGNDMTVDFTEVEQADQVTLTVPHRIFYRLGVKLGEKPDWDSRAGSFENYKGSLPDTGGEA